MKTGAALIKSISECQPGPGRLAFWWLGQLGFVFKCGTVVIVIDAFLSDHPRRVVPPLVKAEEITNADYVLGTHDHADHIDHEAWRQIAVSSPRAKFVAPALLAPSLAGELGIHKDRMIGLDDGASFDDHGLVITAVASAHELLDRDEKTGMYPYLGYVVEMGGAAVYHSGDCCRYEGLLQKLKRWNRLDVMVLPINGRDGRRFKQGIIGNMTFQEAVDLAGELHPRLVVPGHYDMFESNLGDPAAFAEYMEAKHPSINFWIGAHGEPVVVDCRSPAD